VCKNKSSSEALCELTHLVRATVKENKKEARHSVEVYTYALPNIHRYTYIDIDVCEYKSQSVAPFESTPLVRATVKENEKAAVHSGKLYMYAILRFNRNTICPLQDIRSLQSFLALVNHPFVAPSICIAHTTAMLLHA